jgi:hypothetical protein
MSAGRFVLVSLVVLAPVLAACREDDTPPPPPPTTEKPADAPPTERVVGPLSEADAAALATMNDRLAKYVELHRKLEATLPPLPESASAKQIDANQRRLEQLMRDARADAKQGDIFTPEAQPVIKRLLRQAFEGPGGAGLKASIMDENPVGLRLRVNDRYPDTVPLSTVPPEVLQTLPKLNEEMEYRFIGDRLILLDVHAHIIADFIPNALPT